MIPLLQNTEIKKTLLFLFIMLKKTQKLFLNFLLFNNYKKDFSNDSSLNIITKTDYLLVIFAKIFLQ